MRTVIPLPVAGGYLRRLEQNPAAIVPPLTARGTVAATGGSVPSSYTEPDVTSLASVAPAADLPRQSGHQNTPPSLSHEGAVPDVAVAGRCSPTAAVVLSKPRRLTERRSGTLFPRFLPFGCTAIRCGEVGPDDISAPAFGWAQWLKVRT